MREIAKFKLEYHSWIPCNTLLLSNICKWLVEEEDTEAGGAFIEAIGAAIATIAHASVMSTTIAQASAIGSQRGSSNL